METPSGKHQKLVAKTSTEVKHINGNSNTSTSLPLSPISPNTDDDNENNIRRDTDLEMTDESGVNGSQTALNIKKRSNNLSGSYNNLFNDECDPSSTAPVTPAITPTTAGSNLNKNSNKYATTPAVPSYYMECNNGVGKMFPPSGIGTGRYYKGPQSGLMAAAVASASGGDGSIGSSCNDSHREVVPITSNRHIVKSVSESENVYCNIPNSNMSSTIITTAINKSDPSLHVYSNLIEERQQHKFQPSSSTMQCLISSSIAASSQLVSSNLKKDGEPISAIDASDSSMIMSSTLLSDNLDLDDPVSAFVMNSHKKYTSKNKARIKRNSDSDKELSKSTNVDITSSIKQSSSHDIITPSRLRLLHDTTMIDTALDLDSLDGSSIGNNSQACLVKNANV